MSRIGNKHIPLPAGVTVTVEGNLITVKGPKGQLELVKNPDISVNVEENNVVVTRPTNDKEHRSLHGTTRALVHNMVVGVSEGYEKVLEIVGVGYRAQLQGNTLVLNLGYSHPVNMELPKGISVTCPSATEVHVLGCDKQVVGEFAAEIRKVRGPEPYKGKGVHYKGEHIRRKEGKKAK
ncbi:MAG: 50S ribosomal protein L6 [Bacilli bacterium]|nr:50S ribosomal protein L6 [Mollicutes bacterium]MDY3899864.1 50S ribosomal protein L6 [Bacilli bacterium]